jgi:hypothetical protein
MTMKGNKKYTAPAIAEIEIGNVALYSVSSTGSSVDFTTPTEGEGKDAGEAMVSQWSMPWDDTTTETESDF